MSWSRRTQTAAGLLWTLGLPHPSVLSPGPGWETEFALGIFWATAQALAALMGFSPGRLGGRGGGQSELGTGRLGGLVGGMGPGRQAGLQEVRGNFGGSSHQGEAEAYRQ